MKELYNLVGNILIEDLIKNCIEEFENKTEIIIKNNQKAYRRFEKAFEICKKDLHFDIGTIVDID